MNNMMNPEMNHQNVSKYINTFFMKQMLVTIDFQTIYYNIHTVYTFESLLKMRDSGTDLFCGFCKVVKSTYFVEHMQTTASENRSIKNNNTLSKKLFFEKSWLFDYSKNLCQKI